MSEHYQDEAVEVEETTGPQDDAVASDSDIEEAFFGDEGPPESDVVEGLEAVKGFDESALEASRESGAEELDDDNLLDVWYADLGDPAVGAMLQRRGGMEGVAEVVIGPDDRVQITGTTSYPWRCICSLKITARDGSRWIGTGWLVGWRTVITAGHCVYIHSRGGWASKIEVIPGRNGASRPYGSCSSSKLRSVTGWTSSKSRNYDYGAIILPSSCTYGKQLGYFGYGNYSSGTLSGLTANLSGYPGDKPAGTQWWHARSIKEVTSRTLVYNIDTAGGQSGSPVWRVKDGGRYGVGIHTNGSSSGNSATRIVQGVFDNIKNWKAQGQY